MIIIGTSKLHGIFKNKYFFVSIEINESGTFINGKEVNKLTLDHLNICNEEYFTFKIGVKDDAKYVGGINIFGKEFGDYAQDIQIIVTYLN